MAGEIIVNPLNFSTACLGEGTLYLAAISCFKILSRPQSQQRCLWTFLFLLSSLTILVYAHITDDFSYLNVVQHGHTHQPLLYKIVGIWGNHEGSLLLWVTELAIYQVLASYFLPKPAKQIVNQLINCLLLIFIIFIIISCNPFLTVINPPFQGEDLNPALQDPSLVFHPPFLYAGYTGMGIPFGLAFYSLFKKQFEQEIVQAMRFWALISWTFLTLGIGLGSFWAYYELGWGGWWFWDPVETISILPWLTTTVLLHTLSSYPRHAKSSLSLAIVGFIFSLAILFFVRSGLLTSVHSFAVDTERGLILFCILILVILFSSYIWLKNHKNFTGEKLSFNLSYPNFINQKKYLIAACLVILMIGILYPLLAESWGEQVTINAYYFQVTFIPLMFPILLGTGFGPWLTKSSFLPSILSAITTTLAVWVIIFWKMHDIPLLGILSLCVGIWILISHLFYLLKIGINFKNLGMIVAHLGIGTAVVGAVLASYGQLSQTITLTPGQTTKLNSTKSIRLINVSELNYSNYFSKRAVLEIYNEEKLIQIVKPERRYYTASKTIHTETAFFSQWLSHLYIVMLDDEGPSYSFQIDYKPFINLLWLGILMMVSGGGLAILNRWNKTRKANECFPLN